jgi:folate-binding protein YgfZ
MTKQTPTHYAIKLDDLGLLQVTGKKAAQFLQGQLTCDINEINERQSRLGAHCDAKGRTQATFRLFFYQNAYYFLLPRRTLPYLLQSLQKYAVFSAVNVVDMTQNWEIIGIGGPSSGDLLSQQALWPNQNNAMASSETIISLAVSNARCILLSTDKKSFSFIDNSFHELPLNTWHLSDIEAGIATIYPETIAQFTPHQLNYPAIGAVSFAKGCYIGQEIIARTHYLGKSKTRLYRITFNAKNNFPPGTPLQNEDTVRQGTLIMSAHEKGETYQALVCLQSQAISHTIHLESPQGPILQILELPYVV